MVHESPDHFGVYTCMKLKVNFVTSFIEKACLGGGGGGGGRYDAIHYSLIHVTETSYT